MHFDDKKLSELLLKESYITESDLAAAGKARERTGGSVVDYLLAQRIVTKDILGQALAESYGLAYADLNSRPPTAEQVAIIDEATAREFRVVVFSQDQKTVTLATDTPPMKGVPQAIKNIFKNKKIQWTYALEDDIEAAFVFYRKKLSTRFTAILEKQNRVAPEIINEIFDDAIVYNASDIHLEPQGKEVVVRFRVDGVLEEAGRLPKDFYDNILNRLKVQANMRIDEHFAAQDGALSYTKNDVITDMRLSIAPTLEGEKAVIRLLSHYVRTFTLSDLGLAAHDEERLVAAADKPYGMILVTGPTGSGKTTTLYAVLKLLNLPDVNITTIEDPVEFKVKGINQIQVNQRTDLTFAKGLRSIVRQDPDIILVGEIRDQETAEISVNAALTGHILLSTFHANDAATAMPRLLDMGIEPFLLASTLQIIVAQRLVRKICESCRYGETVAPLKLKTMLVNATDFFGTKAITLYKGKGCSACNNTGYKGRVGIFEFITMTPELQELVLKHPSTQQIWQLARSQGARSLFEDGVEKVKNGATTLEELLRVAPPPTLLFGSSALK